MNSSCFLIIVYEEYLFIFVTNFDKFEGIKQEGINGFKNTSIVNNQNSVYK